MRSCKSLLGFPNQPPTYRRQVKHISHFWRNQNFIRYKHQCGKFKLLFCSLDLRKEFCISKDNVYVKIHWTLKKRSLISLCAVFSFCRFSPPSVCLKRYTESAECGFWLFHTHLKNSTKCEPRGDRCLVAWNVSGSEASLSLSSCWSSLLIPKLLVTLLTLQCLLSPVCWCNCCWGCRLKISLQREVVFSF